jgi:capsular polysaccharide biosynthesis protein
LDKWTRNGHRPSREEAYQLLRHRLDLDEVRNTNLLQISVFDTDPEEAANIANEIVTV